MTERWWRLTPRLTPEKGSRDEGALQGRNGGLRVMTSTDGVTFEQAKDWGPKGNLTGIPGDRDVTIVKHDGTFYSYATVTTSDGERGCIVAATSTDLKQWENRGIVCEAPAGGSPPLTLDHAVLDSLCF